MKVKIDFELNRGFGMVEQIIFRLVLNGYTNVSGIAEVLPIFSDAVIANGIKTLVNRQILSAHNGTRSLALSEPLVAIIEMCLKSEHEVEVPTSLRDALTGDGLLISSVDGESGKELEKAILCTLLPGIKLDMYADSLDFVMRGDVGGGNHE